MDEFDYIEDLAGASLEDLAGSEQADLAAVDALRAVGDDLTDDQVSEMERLAEYVGQVRTEGERRETAAAERRAHIDSLAESLVAEDTETPSEEEESAEAED